MLRARGERFGEALADVTGPVDVRFNRYRALRVRDSFQHCGIEFVSVVENLDRVSFEEGNAGRSRDRRQKLIVVHAELVLEADARRHFARPCEKGEGGTQSRPDRPAPVVVHEGGHRGDAPYPPREYQLPDFCPDCSNANLTARFRMLMQSRAPAARYAAAEMTWKAQGGPPARKRTGDRLRRRLCGHATDTRAKRIPRYVYCFLHSTVTRTA